MARSTVESATLRESHYLLRKEIQDARVKLRNKSIEASRAFKEKYGDELSGIALIFSDDSELHRVGYTYSIHGNAPTSISEVAETYSNALITALDQRPRITRANWLNEFFMDLSSVLQFRE